MVAYMQGGMRPRSYEMNAHAFFKVCLVLIFLHTKKTYPVLKFPKPAKKILDLKWPPPPPLELFQKIIQFGSAAGPFPY